MNRSTPIWDNDGPEYEPEPFDDRRKRLDRFEMQTRILENNTQMLVDVVEAFRKGWTTQ
jgi:hypothetical protein